MGSVCACVVCLVYLRTTISSMQHGCILRASEHGDDPDTASQMSTGQESELTEVVHSLNSYAGHMLTLFHDYRALRDREREQLGAT
jgi:hypothetical protein